MESTWTPIPAPGAPEPGGSTCSPASTYWAWYTGWPGVTASFMLATLPPMESIHV